MARKNNDDVTMTTLVLAVLTFILVMVIISLPVEITYSGKFNFNADIKGLFEDKEKKVFEVPLKIESVKGAGDVDNTVTIKAPFIFFWAYGKSGKDITERNPVLDSVSALG